MAKEEKGQETSDFGVRIPPETEPPKDETPTEDLAALSDQLSQLKIELEQTKKGLSTAHQTLTEKDRELKKRADLELQIGGIQETVELLATAIASGRQAESFEPAEKQDILADLTRKRADLEAKRKQAETEQTRLEYVQKADAIYARAKDAFGDDDDALERVEDLLGNGRLERAEARVSKAEQSKTKKPSETDEQRIERLVAERLTEELRKKGLLETHDGSPQGGTDFEQARADYIKNPSNPKVFKRYIEAKARQ